MAGRKPKGEQARTEKIMFAIAPQMLSDFKAVAFIQNKTMTERMIELMAQEIRNNSKELQAFRKIQTANTAQ